MKRLGFIFKYLFAFQAVILILFIVGCARTPSGILLTQKRELTFQIQFDAPINEAYYYFIAIDTNTDNGKYPTPIFPSLLTGDRWVTGGVTHFIRYYQGKYTLYKVNNLDTFDVEPIGAPIRFDRSDPSSLVFTIDLNDIQATGQSIEVNFITANQLGTPTRFLDALGKSGTEFLEIGITNDQTVINTGVETTGDVLNENREIQPSTDLIKPLDIKDFRIQVDV